jgi:hypothetical protein
MTTVFLDASVGGRDGPLGRLAAARGYSLKIVLEEGVHICVVASSVTRQAPSITTSKRAKRMMLSFSTKQLTTADVRAPARIFQYPLAVLLSSSFLISWDFACTVHRWRVKWKRG